jgi:ubiquinone/menaquinone biosynthesis C-methylase UbiE
MMQEQQEGPMSGPRPGYRDSDQDRDFFARRTAETHAGWFRPYLKPGISLLDCGCGPGSMTVGLAEWVAPGEVVGIDIGVESLTLAEDRIREAGLNNVRVQEANVYELPFPDGSFDAAFSHAVVDHLEDNVAALREIRRVLVPGGVLGVRGSDLGGLIQYPDPDGLLRRFLEMSIEMRRRADGNPQVGRHLRGILHEAGYQNVVATASFESHGSSQAVSWIAEYMVAFIRRDRTMVERGLCDDQTLDACADAFEAWGKSPGAFLARPFGEAIGWTP